MSENIHIMDPVHGLIVFHHKKKLKPLIDHVLFQRLRHIKQLGMGEYVFPGAVHNRFIHSIGAAHIANEFYQALRQDNAVLNDTMIPILTALLHDIGHGPFSHAFEYLFEFPANMIRHEDWGAYFLEELLACPTLGILHDELQETAKILNKDYARFQPVDFLFEDIISSQLDADRLDYLLRDAMFCGVDYGKCELSWIVHNLRALEIKDDNNQSRLRLGIHKRGIGAIEQYLMARRWMMQNVYHHPTVQLLQRLMTLFLGMYRHAITHQNRLFFQPFDQFLMNLDKLRSGQVSKQAFIESNYAYYKQLTDHHIYDLIRFVLENKAQFSSELSSLAHCLFYRELPTTIAIEDATLLDEATHFMLNQSYPSWQLGILHEEVMLYSINDRAILVAEEGGRKSLNHYSPVIKAHEGHTEFKHYLYIHPDIQDHRDIRNFMQKFLSTSMVACGD